MDTKSINVKQEILDYLEAKKFKKFLPVQEEGKETRKKRLLEAEGRKVRIKKVKKKSFGVKIIEVPLE